MKRPLVGINPSGMIMREEKRATIVARAVDNLVENLSATIIMIPHVYTDGVDDRATIESIIGKIRNKSNIRAIRNEYTPQDIL